MSSWSALDEETRQMMFERFRARMNDLGANGKVGYADFCPELNPDVIVIEGDQTLFFEPQNERAATILQERFGSVAEIVHVRERVRVHPCEGQKIIATLTAAGLKVAS